MFLIGLGRVLERVPQVSALGKVSLRERVFLKGSKPGKDQIKSQPSLPNGFPFFYREMCGCKCSMEYVVVVNRECVVLYIFFSETPHNMY